jgi:hypothetical protein
MTDLELQKTISCGSKGRTGQYGSTTPPAADHVSFNPAQVGAQYGWVTVLTPERRYTRGWSGAMVLAKCRGCGRESWAYLGNLARGKSNGCQSCSQPKQVPEWLEKRCTAWRQRCENPKDKGFKNYGARGIRFEFATVLEAGLWVLANLGANKALELDRKDNNGPYAPGNLRYLTRREQTFNMRRTKSNLPDYEWAATGSPLSFFTTRRYLILGLSRGQIVERAKQSVAEKRKNWRGILSRLNTLGYLTS